MIASTPTSWENVNEVRGAYEGTLRLTVFTRSRVAVTSKSDEITDGEDRLGECRHEGDSGNDGFDREWSHGVLLFR